MQSNSANDADAKKINEDHLRAFMQVDPAAVKCREREEANRRKKEKATPKK